MVLVHVQHPLDAIGQSQFDEWLDAAASALRGFSGFRTIRRAVDCAHPGLCQLVLEFDSLAQLRAWSASPEHSELMARLGPHRTAPWVSHVWELGPRLDTGSDGRPRDSGSGT